MGEILELNYDDLDKVDFRQIVNYGAHFYRVFDSDRNLIFESDNEHELEDFIINQK